MTCCSHGKTVPCNKCDIVSVNKLDVKVEDYLEQFGGLHFQVKDCAM